MNPKEVKLTAQDIEELAADIRKHHSKDWKRTGEIASAIILKCIRLVEEANKELGVS